MTIPDNKPEVQLVGEDGNAFSILARCKAAADDAGWAAEQFDEFSSKATSSSYDYLLCTVIEYFSVIDEYDNKHDDEFYDDYNDFDDVYEDYDEEDDEDYNFKYDEFEDE